jgi:hypothetical protein
MTRDRRRISKDRCDLLLKRHLLRDGRVRLGCRMCYMCFQFIEVAHRQNSKFVVAGPLCGDCGVCRDCYCLPEEELHKISISMFLTGRRENA